jgi:5'-methylthioadenosine phosphorylase
MLGCDALLSASACGSLREELPPRTAVVPDQFIDRTRHRADTFFGGGLVAHAGLADPVCAVLSDALAESGREAGLDARLGGTYVCMEGPQFSTRAESHLYRSWGADVIG